MWSPTIFVLLTFLFLNKGVTTVSTPDLSTSISKFATSLYTNAIKGQTSNVILSPFSAQIILTLSYMGATGETADIMSKGLNLSGTKETISGQMHELIGSLQKNPSLKVADKIYVMQTYTIKKTFEVTARRNFFSEVQSINFAQKTEAAAIINNWVANETNDKITNLISPDSLGADTRMVLVNAIYFKDMWRYQFVKSDTAKTPFYTDVKASVQVDMMHVQARFRYGQFSDLDASCIELPYKNSNMSMLVILPNKRTGLAALETHLETLDINRLSNNMALAEVKVSFPKFKIEFKLSLVSALRTMRMAEMFSASANFSDLLESKQPLYISDVVQKAFIDVDEMGTVAAAATAVTIGRMAPSAPTPPPIVFNANHPFTFILKMRNDILFIGKFIR